MSEISIEIMDYLEQGVHPVKIARLLDIPLTWIYDTLETMEEDSFDPFNTINS